MNSNVKTNTRRRDIHGIISEVESCELPQSNFDRTPIHSVLLEWTSECTSNFTTAITVTKLQILWKKELNHDDGDDNDDALFS
jgi:hypothetical protein